MNTDSKREYLRNRFANLTEEQRELHNKRNLQHYHSMSEFARRKHIAKMKAYYQNNKERMKEYQREYYARVKQNFGETIKQNLQQISFTNNL